MTTDEDTSSSLVLCSVKLLDIPCRRGLAKDDHLVDPAAEVLALVRTRTAVAVDEVPRREMTQPAAVVSECVHRDAVDVEGHGRDAIRTGKMVL